MFSVDSVRTQFPSLARCLHGKPIIYLDGPAGTQVPQSVADRVSDVLIHHSANRSGKFITSHEVDAIMDEAHRAAADLLGAEDPRSVAFGPNMTTMTLQFSRALAKTWNPGDEVIVSRLDHDANFTPWILAAKDAGATVRMVDINPIDATLCMKSLSNQLGPKTRLVAVTAASNAVGSLTDIPTIADIVHEAGAELFVDAVHFAPHRRIDVKRWNCDYMVCSAYKFFGPHIGILYGRPQRMQELKPYKLRPSPDSIPGRWMTGTQNHACIAGVTAAIDYIASLAGSGTSRREKLDIAFNDIVNIETRLIANLIEGLQCIHGVKLFGITDVDRMQERAPTVAFQIAGISSADAAATLGEQGICGWHGNYYALPLTEALKTEPEGMIRLGCMHYNTQDEIARTLDVIQTIASAVA